MTKKTITKCPKCGSSCISADLTNAASVLTGSNQRMCNDCGYSSTFFPEVDINEEQKTNRKSNKKDSINSKKPPEQKNKK